MMNCDVCNAPMKDRRMTAQAPYHYALAGLPHIGLANIDVYECPMCRAIVPVIPRVGELHRVIAEMFIRKPDPLMGVELRFLRKNAGFSAQKFAALLVIDPSHLSRVENGKQKGLGPSTDRLARAIVAAAAGGKNVREMLLRQADKILERKKKRTPATFELARNRWRLAA